MVQAAADFEEEPPAMPLVMPCNDENERPMLQHQQQLHNPNHVMDVTPMEQDHHHHHSNNEIRVNNVGRARASPLSVVMRGGSSNQQQEKDEEGRDGNAEAEAPAATYYHYHAGMFLDVLDTVDRWSEAEVLEVDHQARQIAITYLYWGDKFDEVLPFDSHRIAPFKTQTYHGDPSQLKLNQRIEVLDEKKEWLEAEVIDFSDDGTQVKVHFRRFKPTFDTWMARTGERIRPFGRNKVIKKKKANQVVEEKQQQQQQQQRQHQASVNLHAVHTRQLAVTSDRYSHYKDALARQNLDIFPVEGDGNCLFRSVSHQVYGNDTYHSLVREKVMAYMDVEKRYFEPYVEGDMEDFMRYLEVKRRDGVWGDDPEVQAICELYDRPAVIWVYDAVAGAKKLRTFHEAGGFSARPDRQPMMLSYYGGGHYDSITARDQMTVVSEPPGVMEDRAIEMARQRNAAVSGVEEMKRRSDEEATEEAAVEAALRASREDFDSFTDLETALELSAQAEIQAELFRTAAEQSEAEMVKKVMEDSLKEGGVVAPPDVDDEIMQAVMESSKAEFGRGTGMEEDDDYKKVVQMSIADSDEQRQLEEAIKLSRSQGDVAVLGGGRPYDLMEEEDPELAAALALSMQQQGDVQTVASLSTTAGAGSSSGSSSSSCGGGSSSSSTAVGLEDPIMQQARSFEMARSKKEEEDLRKALAASLEEN